MTDSVNTMRTAFFERRARLNEAWLKKDCDYPPKLDCNTDEKLWRELPDAFIHPINNQKEQTLPEQINSLITTFNEFKQRLAAQDNIATGLFTEELSQQLEADLNNELQAAKNYLAQHAEPTIVEAPGSSKKISPSAAYLADGDNQKRITELNKTLFSLIEQLTPTYFDELFDQNQISSKKQLFDNLLSYFKGALEQSLQTYEKRFPKRASSKKRSKDINEIRRLISSESVGCENLILSLERYFLGQTDDSEKFDPGYFNRSDLEATISKCIFNFDPLYCKAVKLFGDPSNETLSEKPIEKTHRDQSIPLLFGLDTFVDFAIDKYCEQRCLDQDKLPPHRQKSVEKIKEIMAGSLSYQDKMTAIKRYLNSDAYEKPFLSNFKKYVLESIAYYEHLLKEKKYPITEDGSIKKEIVFHFWDAHDGNQAKFVFFVHGWKDSVEAATHIAQLFQKNNVNFIGFDTWGHGHDLLERGPKRSFPKLHADLLRITLRQAIKHLTADKKGVILAHSLGGSLAAAEFSQFINKIDNIDALVLQGPAASFPAHSNLTNPFNRKEPLMSREAFDAYRKHSQPLNMVNHRTTQAPAYFERHNPERQRRRNGSSSLPLFSLLVFMREAFRALLRLITRHLITPFNKPIHCICGENDMWGISSVAKHIQKQANPEKHPITFTYLHRAGHFLDPRHHRTQLGATVDIVMKSFENRTSSEIQENTQCLGNCS